MSAPEGHPDHCSLCKRRWDADRARVQQAMDQTLEDNTELLARLAKQAINQGNQ